MSELELDFKDLGIRKKFYLRRLMTYSTKNLAKALNYLKGGEENEHD